MGALDFGCNLNIIARFSPLAYFADAKFVFLQMNGALYSLKSVFVQNIVKASVQNTLRIVVQNKKIMGLHKQLILFIERP